MLSELLEKHHGTKVILLIDEYDVPLARAHANGYYEQMISLIRSFLGEALKTNSSLKFAVLTGCLRISKESIFTGLNNLKVRSVTDVRFDEYFGFTDTEVKALLGVKDQWGISSNREMGEGYADILAEPDTGDMGIIIEVKYAHDGNLDSACKAALKQIENTRYENDLEDYGIENILKYGIAFYKKRCKVMLAEMNRG